MCGSRISGTRSPKAPRRRVVAALLLGLAAANPILPALRAQNWPAAEALAGADPLARKLVTFIRLLKPGQATAAELDAFIDANPGWPDLPQLRQRRDQALAREPDPVEARQGCAARQPTLPAALVRCAGLLPPDAARLARAAWVELPATDAPDFLARFAGLLRPTDDWARFDRVAVAAAGNSDPVMARLDPPHHTAALAWLAFRRGEVVPVDALPPDLRAWPGLVLDRVRCLRRAGQLAAAAALWRTDAAAAESAAPVARQAAFWGERDRLARALLAAGQDGPALQVATDTAAARPEDRAESLFLSGWILLRVRHDVAAASARFAALADLAHGAITRARAFYWLGRARAAQGDAAGARQAWQQAGAWPVAFYGQRALEALGRPLVLPADPAAPPARAAAFEQDDRVRAARLLAAWGDPRRARDFVALLAARAPDEAAFALAAHLATDLGLDQTAVEAARLAGRAGFMLPLAGWPVPLLPPAGHAPPALVLGLIRQESSFDPGAVSPAGAIGLMQVRPGTAAGFGGGDLTQPANNLRVGRAYLDRLLDRFATAAQAVAAYDAGPERVAAWGDPGEGDTRLDWMERIPFPETRGYVQRVMENEAVYTVKLPR